MPSQPFCFTNNWEEKRSIHTFARAKSAQRQTQQPRLESERGTHTPASAPINATPRASTLIFLRYSSQLVSLHHNMTTEVRGIGRWRSVKNEGRILKTIASSSTDSAFKHFLCFKSMQTLFFYRLTFYFHLRNKTRLLCFCFFSKFRICTTFPISKYNSFTDFQSLYYTFLFYEDNFC